jgi:hypothetical protein
VVHSIRLILDAMEEAQQGDCLPIDDDDSDHSIAPIHYPTLTVEHLKLRMRLLPLQRVEELLLQRLSWAGSTEFEPTQPMSFAQPCRRKEFAVHSSSPWKNALAQLLNAALGSFDQQSEFEFTDPDDPGVVLNACSEDMIRLWNDPTIQELLRVMRIRLEDMAGLYVCSIFISLKWFTSIVS